MHMCTYTHSHTTHIKFILQAEKHHEQKEIVRELLQRRYSCRHRTAKYKFYDVTDRSQIMYFTFPTFLKNFKLKGSSNSNTPQNTPLFFTQSPRYVLECMYTYTHSYIYAHTYTHTFLLNHLRVTCNDILYTTVISTTFKTLKIDI